MQLRDTAIKLIKDLKTAEENCQKKKREYENLRKAQDKSQVLYMQCLFDNVPIFAHQIFFSFLLLFFQEDYEKATFNNAQSPAVEKLAKKVSADTKSAEAGDAKYQV